MEKRGQVSVFVIIGIVVLVLITLVFFFRDRISEAIREEPTDTQQYLVQQLDDIKRAIGVCVNSKTKDAAKILMENGGVLNRNFNYIPYSNRKYAILCREFVDGDGCLSEPILISKLQEKLDKYLITEISSCVDFEAFKNKDYNIESGSMGIVAAIFEDSILIKLNFPVSLEKDAYIVEGDDFVYNVDVPIGKLTNAANRIIAARASGNVIDPVSFGLISMNMYNLRISKPYPDELYELRLTADENYVYYFAVEGVGRFDREANIR